MSTSSGCASGCNIMPANLSSGMSAWARRPTRSPSCAPRGTFACRIRLVSFDHTLEPLQFALKHAAELGYFGGYENHLQRISPRASRDVSGRPAIGELGISPRRFSGVACQFKTQRPKCETRHAPHAILFDAFSPAKNPAMWTLPLFTKLFQRLDPQRPCALPTYSRSTILRVTLLLAGFFVGVGHATGEKEETTIAANDFEFDRRAAGPPLA